MSEVSVLTCFLIYALDSLSSSPTDIEMTNFDKTPSNDTESNNGSDEDDMTKKKQRSSIDDYADFDNEDLDETDPRNIWRKKRKLSNIDSTASVMHTDVSKGDTIISNTNQLNGTNELNKVDRYPKPNSSYLKPHDHQVPAPLPVQRDDVMLMSNKLVVEKIYLSHF